MKSEQVNAFLGAALAVLGERVAAQPHRGSPMLRSGRTRSVRELTAVVGLEGGLTGSVFCGMSQATAVKLRQAGLQPAEGGSEGAVAGELARLTAAGGVGALEQQGVRCEAGEARVVAGAGHELTEFTRVLVVPLLTEHGDIDVGLALAPAAAQSEAPPVPGSGSEEGVDEAAT